MVSSFSADISLLIYSIHDNPINSFFNVKLLKNDRHTDRQTDSQMLTDVTSLAEV